MGTFIKTWDKSAALPYYWVSKDDRFALWFKQDHNRWILGDKKSWNSTAGYVFAEAAVACPEFASAFYNAWQYNHGAKGWLAAGRGFGLYCDSKDRPKASFKRQRRSSIVFKIPDGFKRGRSQTQTMAVTPL